MLRAEDSAGPRAYEYFGATGQQIRLGEAKVDVETNLLGLMAGFSNGHQSVSISYNALDQLSDVAYVEYGDVYEVAYTYGESGLRSGGSYLIAEDQRAPASLSLEYDVVGNLTNLTLEAPNGARSSQTYVLGMNNQLTRLMNPNRSDLVFEYDTAGRPTRRTLGTNDVSYSYDSLGRITAVHEREQKIVEWLYGPMDVDAATEGDDHTPWTAISEPIASAIFGSAESIAYVRMRGTPFGPIRFNAAMARFVVPPRLIPSADTVALVSLQRRNVLVPSDHHASVSPAPLAFDKPSNALFLPPEFSSLNCYMCMGWFEGPGPIMTINGSTGTPTVVAGSVETITVSGSTQCKGDVWIDWEPAYTESGEVSHYFSLGDGNWIDGGTSSTVNKTVYGVHYATGVYTVRDDISCGCYYGGFYWDLVQAERDVEVCDASEFELNKARFAGPRTPVIQRYQGQNQGGVFKFHMNVFGDAVSQSDVVASFMYWNDVENTPSCGAYDVTATSQYLTSRLPGEDIIFRRVAGLTDCGNFDPTDPTVEVLSVAVTPGGTCGPVPEIFAHEIGHALGFQNSLNTDPTDIMNSPRGAPRKVKDYHAQTLLEYY